ncbi:MAG: ion transporter, partial [Myxococcota bacterium]
VFFWADVLITVCFVIEYALKLLVAPRKWYFIRKNLLDLLAILPIMRIFRLGRAVRLFRLLRMLRIIRVGSVVERQFEKINAERQKFRMENTVIGAYLFFSLVFGTVGIMVFEKGADSGFNTLGDGLWWCVVTLTTVGYGDISPTTAGGKFVATIIMFIGLSFYALLTSTISTILIERARNNQDEEMEISTLEHHVVICGWNAHGLGLLQDLIPRPDAPHVVILTDNDIPRVQHSRVFYILQDPSTARGLAAARVKHADVVVVLADPTWGTTQQDVDARTILTVLAVEQMRPAVHTIAELLNTDNIFHAHNAGVDEVMISGQFTGAMLSQAVQSPGMTDVVDALFQAGGETAFREGRLPAHLTGQRFQTAATRLLTDEHIIILGVRRGTQLHVAPREDIVLEADDQLIYLQRDPTLSAS